jgi:hypothetical protein
VDEAVAEKGVDPRKKAVQRRIKGIHHPLRGGKSREGDGFIRVKGIKKEEGPSVSPMGTAETNVPPSPGESTAGLEKEVHTGEGGEAGVLELPRHFIFVVGQVDEIEMGLGLVAFVFEQDLLDLEVDRLVRSERPTTALGSAVIVFTDGLQVGRDLEIPG